MRYRLDLDYVFMKYTNQNPITFRFIILDVKHERNPFQTLRIFFPYKVGRVHPQSGQILQLNKSKIFRGTIHEKSKLVYILPLPGSGDGNGGSTGADASRNKE